MKLREVPLTALNAVMYYDAGHDLCGRTLAGEMVERFRAAAATRQLLCSFYAASIQLQQDLLIA